MSRGVHIADVAVGLLIVALLAFAGRVGTDALPWPQLESAVAASGRR